MLFLKRCLLLSFPHLGLVVGRRPWQEELGMDSAFGGEVRTKVGNASVPRIERRQGASQLSTCGYYDGDPTKSRTAGPGDDCRFDTARALWGFCPTTVISASDCGLAGNCVDSYSCSKGCGIFGTPTITTFTCATSSYCSTVLWTGDSPDVIFSYIACGAAAVTEHLLANPTPVAPSSTSTTPVSTTAAPASSPSSTHAPSTSPASTQSSSQITSSAASAILTSSTSSTSTTSTLQSQVLSSTTTTTSSPGPASTTPNNLGAIIGGIVGGLAIICIFVLGLLYLRRSRRNQREEEPQRRNSTWWQRGPRVPEMQTAGLHEKEGNIPQYHEVQGSGAENNRGYSMQKYGVYGEHPGMNELPS